MPSAVGPLAIDGGAPVRCAPFPAWPVFGPEEIEATVSVLRSGRVNYWTGDQGRLFEHEFAESCEVKHAVAVANGTVALELALRAFGIGPGDDVVTPCRSYVASASCVAVCGAKPVMADVDRDSQTITLDSVRSAITARTKAIIAVHLGGWPCELGPIRQFAAERGVMVIEDCAQAQGARYKGAPVGSVGHAAAFSFCQDKIMTTGGEGGMLVTNDDLAWQRARSYRDHGRRYDDCNAGTNAIGYRWVYDSVGTNWRITEMQSAIGRTGLRRVEANVERRRAIASRLNDAFADVAALRRAIPPEQVDHVYYRYYVFVRREQLRPGWDRDRVLRAILAEGIPCFTGSCPEIYRERGFESTRPARPFSIAPELGETSLAFLVHPTLSDSDIGDTITAVRKVMSHASAS